MLPANVAIRMFEIGYSEKGTTGLVPDDMGKFVVDMVRSLMSEPAISRALREMCSSLTLLSGDPLQEVTGIDLDTLARDFLYVLLEDGGFLNTVKQLLPPEVAERDKQDCFSLLWEKLFLFSFRSTKEATPSSVLHFMLLPVLYTAGCTHVKITLGEVGSEGDKAYDFYCKRRGQDMETRIYCGVGSTWVEGDRIDLKLSGDDRRHFVTVSLGKSPTRAELDQFISVPPKLWLLTEDLKKQRLQRFEECSVDALLEMCPSPSVSTAEVKELQKWLVFCKRYERW